MTDEPTDVQPEGEGEVQEPPTPVISAGSTDVSSAGPSFDADSLADKVLEKLSPTLDSLVDARFKSGKDVRFAKVEVIASWVKESGGDFDKIRGALTESELTTRIEALEAGSGGAGGTAPATDTVEKYNPDSAAEILQEAGIAFGDPDVVAWSETSFTSDAQAEIALKSIVSKRAKQASVGPSATVVAGGRPASTEETDDELLERIEVLLKHPLQNVEEREKLLAEARKRELMR